MKFTVDKKYIIAVLLGIVVLFATDILIPVIGIIGGLHLIYSAVRHEDKRKPLGILSTGIILFAFAWEYTEHPIIEETHSERIE